MTHRPSQPSSDSTLKPSEFTVALLGNPNTGKSTLFNVLAGTTQKTGNYAGVTVSKRTGTFQHAGRSFQVIDLPGTYSLAPRTPDEMLTVNVLIGNPPQHKHPDVLVCVIDASNLERNLFLASQILELDQPTVIALNMNDVAARNGIKIDTDQLANRLGVPVIEVQANRKLGIDTLKKTIAGITESGYRSCHNPFSDSLNKRIDRLEKACIEGGRPSRFILTRMLFDTDGFMVAQKGSELGETFLAAVQTEQEQMRVDGTFAECESKARYDWIQDQLPEILTISDSAPTPMADKIDRWLTHPILGLAFAIVAMTFLFQIIFWAADPATTAIEWLQNLATSGIDAVFVGLTGQADGALHSLLVNGIIAGVGGVLVFLPQIMLLFMILAILEDSGYLSRLAFLMDRFLARIGLSGITLIPLLSSFACAIPGIMATRVIKNDRERLITILIAPLMSCSARLPVYTLFIAAFVPATTVFGLGLQGLTMLAMYLVGVVVAVMVAWILKKTILKTGSSSFVMELPAYQIPRWRNVWLKVYEGGASFIKDAGTIIVLATIVVWAAAYFPRDPSTLPASLVERESELTLALKTIDGEAGSATPTAPDSMDKDILKSELAAISNQVDLHYLRNSYLGRTGKFIEPVVKPLGWDWRIGSAAIAAFPAREVLVSTLGVLFGLGGDVDESSTALKSSLQDATWDGSERKLIDLPVALSIMVFFALCAQCSSTLAVIKRETNSWAWPLFTFAYMTLLAYAASFVTFQFFHWIIG